VAPERQRRAMMKCSVRHHNSMRLSIMSDQQLHSLTSAGANIVLGLPSE
jgi:hypothetical protein